MEIIIIESTENAIILLNLWQNAQKAAEKKSVFMGL